MLFSGEAQEKKIKGEEVAGNPGNLSAAAAARTPSAVWHYLLGCHRRFAQSRPLPQNNRQLSLDGVNLADEQRPFAALLSCSDSRTPAEIIFNVGIGELFVIRNAGHMPSSSVIASLEYAVQVLQVPLVVVLAHDRCAVLQAALGLGPESLPPLITQKVQPLLERLEGRQLNGHQGKTGRTTSEFQQMARQEHLHYTIEVILRRSELIAEAIAAGRIGLVGAQYWVQQGRVAEMCLLGPVTSPKEDAKVDAGEAAKKQQKPDRETIEHR